MNGVYALPPGVLWNQRLGRRSRQVLGLKRVAGKVFINQRLTLLAFENDPLFSSWERGMVAKLFRSDTSFWEAGTLKSIILSLGLRATKRSANPESVAPCSIMPFLQPLDQCTTRRYNIRSVIECTIRVNYRRRAQALSAGFAEGHWRTL